MTKLELLASRIFHYMSIHAQCDIFDARKSKMMLPLKQGMISLKFQDTIGARRVAIAAFIVDDRLPCLFSCSPPRADSAGFAAERGDEFIISLMRRYRFLPRRFSANSALDATIFRWPYGDGADGRAIILTH